MDGAPQPVPREILAAFCRGPFGTCPAYRYLRAAGRLVHPSDFTAWVVQGVAPGRVEPDVLTPTDGDMR